MPRLLLKGPATAKRIITRFGGAEVVAVLNDSETACAFYNALPLTVPVSNTSGLDYCGIMPVELPWDESQVHYGWKDGAMNYNPHGGECAVKDGMGQIYALFNEVDAI